MDTRLLDMLRCPQTQRPLRLLDKGRLQALNQAFASGRIGSAGSPPVAWTAALVTDDGRFAYRIEDDIPVLLAGEGVEIDAIETPATIHPGLKGA